MLVRVFAISFAALLLACSQAEPEVKIETEIIRIPVVTEVVKEVLVVTEVPVEVIVEAPVALPNCPPASEVDWLIWSLEDARAMHQAWADYLASHPVEEGTMLWKSVESTEAQLSRVAAYDRRLSIVRQLQQACAP